MDRKILKLFLALALVQHVGVAHAEPIADLPNPFEDSDFQPSEAPKKEPSESSSSSTVNTPSTMPGRNERKSIIYYPKAPATQESSSTSLEISSISRKTDGAWYILELKQGGTLSDLQITALNANLKIHEGYVLLKNGLRVTIREFSPSAQLITYSTLRSESLSNLTGISSIQLRMESFGGFATAKITASSNETISLGLKDNSDSQILDANCPSKQTLALAVAPFEQDMIRWSNQKMRYYQGTAEYTFAENQAIKAGRKILDEADSSLKCAPLSMNQLLLQGDQFARKSTAYYQNTLENIIYRNLSRMLLKLAPARYEVEVKATYKNVRALEIDMENFARRQTGYYAGTDQYGVFEKLTLSAAIMAESAYRVTSERLTYEQRVAQRKYYDQKRAGHYAGTALHDHYTIMRDMVR